MIKIKGNHIKLLLNNIILNLISQICWNKFWWVFIWRGHFLAEVGVAVVLPGLDKVFFFLENCLETIYYWREFCVSKFWKLVHVYYILELLLERRSWKTCQQIALSLSYFSSGFFPLWGTYFWWWSGLLSHVYATVVYSCC